MQNKQQNQEQAAMEEISFGRSFRF